MCARRTNSSAAISHPTAVKSSLNPSNIPPTNATHPSWNNQTHRFHCNLCPTTRKFKTLGGLDQHLSSPVHEETSNDVCRGGVVEHIDVAQEQAQEGEMGGMVRKGLWWLVKLVLWIVVAAVVWFVVGTVVLIGLLVYRSTGEEHLIGKSYRHG